MISQQEGILYGQKEKSERELDKNFTRRQQFEFMTRPDAKLCDLGKRNNVADFLG